MHTSPKRKTREKINLMKKNRYRVSRKIMWAANAQKQNNQPTMANAWLVPPGKREIPGQCRKTTCDGPPPAALCHSSPKKMVVKNRYRVKTNSSKTWQTINCLPAPRWHLAKRRKTKTTINQGGTEKIILSLWPIPPHFLMSQCLLL